MNYALNMILCKLIDWICEVLSPRLKSIIKLAVNKYVVVDDVTIHQQSSNNKPNG